jgi:two-component system chemotaxis response regulator CheB
VDPGEGLRDRPSAVALHFEHTNIGAEAGKLCVDLPRVVNIESGYGATLARFGSVMIRPGPTISQLESRDIIVIGASAGGVPALLELVSGLPSDLRAAVFIVLHMSPNHPSLLPELLTHRGSLPATHAVHGEGIQRGRIYVAPPDNHLMLHSGGYLHVARGPKENGHRPSVDVLFRTASRVFGPRVIGVVLTGYLDCGTAGMLSIKARGGLAVVQDPREADAADMPRSVIKHVEVDHVVPLHEIPGLLTRLADEPADARPANLPATLGEIEGDKPGVPTEIVCPICQGTLTAAELRGFMTFRCHTGHAFSLESMAFEQAEEVERALWAAIRALEESVAMVRRLVVRTNGEVQRRLAEKAEIQARQAQVIRQFLLHGGVLSRSDAASLAAPTPSMADENPS